jgi:hypothetical protein
VAVTAGSREVAVRTPVTRDNNNDDDDDDDDNNNNNNPLTPELNPSAQRCLTRFFTGDFAS